MNKVREMWRRGEKVVAGWLHIPSAIAAETLARAGYDALVVDLQHSSIDFAECVAMMTAIEAAGAEPFVRTQWNEASSIMKLLDSGAYGIIAPMVNSESEARALASAVHYPPRGQRSWGPRRPLLRYPKDYAGAASASIVSLAMIETREALDNLDGILKADIDGVFIGPADLSLALGGPAVSISEAPDVVAAIRAIRERAHAAGKKAGIFCATARFAREKLGEGFDLVTTTPDLWLLAAAARTAVEESRGTK
jgi:4-hydroxy-2-oxoheptanedioate aldolase